MLSALFNEFFFALGAGDGDLSLASGYTHRLAAAGAIEILMLPILDPLQQLQEFPVLLISLVGVAGEAAEQRPEHQTVGQQEEDHIQKSVSKEYGQNAHGYPGP